MVLGASEIQRYIQRGVVARIGKDKRQIIPEGSDLVKDTFGQSLFPLIDNVPEGFLLEGVQADLSLDSVFEATGKGIKLFKDSRSTSEMIELKDQDGIYEILPGKYYFGTTREILNMPMHLKATVIPRTTTFRACLTVDCANVSPNYFGTLTFGFKLNTNEPVLLERGFRMVSVEFETFEGSANAYVGQWQGGRITTNGQTVGPR